MIHLNRGDLHRSPLVASGCRRGYFPSTRHTSYCGRVTLKGYPTLGLYTPLQSHFCNATCPHRYIYESLSVLYQLGNYNGHYTEALLLSYAEVWCRGKLKNRTLLPCSRPKRSTSPPPKPPSRFSGCVDPSAKAKLAISNPTQQIYKNITIILR